MHPNLKKAWLERLEDPKSRKARGRLRNKTGGMCCLGHLAEIAYPNGKWDESGNYLPHTQASDYYHLGMLEIAWAKPIIGTPIRALVHANDRFTGFPLKQIRALPESEDDWCPDHLQ